MITPEDEQFVSGIYNYCDRWCERCEFTASCRNFAMQRELADEAKDINNEAFVRNLKNIFADAKAMLVEMTEELGIEAVPISDEEFAEIRAREKKFIKGQEITKLAEKYALDARPVLESKDKWLAESEVDQEIQDEVIGVLYWYLFFIAAKIQRGIHGTLDVDGFEDPDDLRDPQSDANGSIKIALIAIERSILAWTYLLTGQNTEVLSPMIKLLDHIRDLTEQKFPNAGNFVRPGFDEIEIVM